MGDRGGFVRFVVVIMGWGGWDEVDEQVNDGLLLYLITFLKYQCFINVI